MKRNDPLSVQIRLTKEEDDKLSALAEGLGTNKPSVLRILLRKVKKIEVIADGLNTPWEPYVDLKGTMHVTEEK